MNKTYYVWGVGESRFEAVRNGETSVAATRAAWTGPQIADRSAWDPRELDSWAVEVTLNEGQDIVIMSKEDPAMRGWAPTVS